MDLELIREGPDYIVVHPDGIVTRFVHLNEHRGELSAMLRISLLCYPGRADGDLHDSKVNLTTGQRGGKGDAVKACEKLCPEFLDWYGLIEKACQLVRYALEEGGPIVHLRDIVDGPLPPFAVSPIVRQKEAALVFGPGGTGKSTLSLMIAILATTGGNQWGLTGSGEQRVLILDWEDEQETQAHRLTLLATGLGIEQPDVMWKRGEGSLAQMGDALSRQIAQEGITGLIVDSAALACGMEPEAADSANSYFRALRSLPITWSVTLAHQPKNMARDPMPFGSAFWWNTPRRIWRVAADREDAALHVGAFHMKANNDRLYDPLAFALSYTDTALTIRQVDPSKIAGFRDKVRGPDRMRAAFEDAYPSSLTYAQLYVLFPEMSEDTVRHTVRRLSDRGELEKIGDGFLLLHPVSSPFPPTEDQPWWQDK